MKTLLTGSSGLVGNALIEYLFARGHSIQCLRHSGESQAGRFWATQALPANGDNRYDAVIHLAGANVAQGRWTTSRKQQILQSRVAGTRELIDFIALLPHKPKIFLCASAVGYYGSREDQILDEDSSSGEGFLADVCRQLEKETERLSDLGVRVINLRFGMILSPKGGALHKMLPPFSLGLGGSVGSGNQYLSWISIRDLVAIVDFLIGRAHIAGPVNIVSPIPTTNRGLAESLGKALKRPAFLRIPGFAAKLLFGQMAEEMLLSSNRVTPKVLLEEDYRFQDQSLDAVLRYCLSGKPEQ